MLLDSTKKEQEPHTSVLEVSAMGPGANSDGKSKESENSNGKKKGQKSGGAAATPEKKEEKEEKPDSSQERDKRIKEAMDKKEKERLEKEAKKEKERKLKQQKEKEKKMKEEKKEKERLEREEKLTKEKLEKQEKQKAKQSKTKQEKKDPKSAKRPARVVSSIEESPEEIEETPSAPVVMTPQSAPKPGQCTYNKPQSYHTYVNISDLDHNIVVIREITSPKQQTRGAEPAVSSSVKGSTKSTDGTPASPCGAKDVRKKGEKPGKARKGGSGCLLCMSRKGHLGSMEDNRNIEEPISPTTKHIVENRQLMTELRAQNFDVIRFATYRTASKLRFIQKRTNLFLVDIWNIIEAFRENGLNSLENKDEVPLDRLESLLSILFYALNKRLPTNAQINAEESISMVLNWMASTYDPESKGKVKVFSIKVGLSTLCSGKLMDKLRYMFTQISDPSGFLMRDKFEDYLKDILAIPSAVYEGPSFGYNDSAGRSCFDGKNKVNVNDFLEKLMSDPGPQCLMWVLILHRMATVENVFHPVQCEVCQRSSFTGFRYKCQRCYNYQQCQECFWRGRVSGNHTMDHEMKEYSSYPGQKSPAKQITHTLRKSFRCVPAKQANNRIPHFPETPEKTLDLSHIVPPTPPPVHNGFNDTSLGRHSGISDVSSMESSSATKSPSKILQGSFDSSRIDDEHRLIARYAARLAADANNAARSPTELNYSLDSNKAQRELIAQLEAKNREIMREIQRLRVEQEAHAKVTPDIQPRNPTLLAELRLLRQRRDELEARMAALQESRRELMVQLEGLMKLLKSHSPRSTPNSSPRSRMPGGSPPGTFPGPRGHSAPTTPGDSLTGLGGDVRQAFSQHNSGASTTGSVRSLRNDLLVAADSVTNAMSSLVKELNSEASSGSEDEDDGLNHKHYRRNHELDELQSWQAEMQQKLQETDFLRQLQARKAPGRHSRTASDSDHYIHVDDGYLMTDDAESYIKTDDESYAMKTDDEIDAELYDRDPKELMPHRYGTDDEAGLETDQESYIRTDDEEGGQSEWEEAMKRWVNR